MRMKTWIDCLIEEICDTEEQKSEVRSAVPKGVDIENVRHIIAIKRLERQIAELTTNDESYRIKFRPAIERVLAYHYAEIAGTATEEMREASESGAWLVVKKTMYRSIGCHGWLSTRSAAWSAGPEDESSAWSARAGTFSAGMAAKSSAGNKQYHSQSARDLHTHAAYMDAWYESRRIERETLISTLNSFREKNEN